MSTSSIDLEEVCKFVIAFVMWKQEGLHDRGVHIPLGNQVLNLGFRTFERVVRQLAE